MRIPYVFLNRIVFLWDQFISTYERVKDDVVIDIIGMRML